jgi:hypothetical protein
MYVEVLQSVFAKRVDRSRVWLAAERLILMTYIAVDKAAGVAHLFMVTMKSTVSTGFVPSPSVEAFM